MRLRDIEPFDWTMGTLLTGACICLAYCVGYFFINRWPEIDGTDWINHNLDVLNESMMWLIYAFGFVLVAKVIILIQRLRL